MLEEDSNSKPAAGAGSAKQAFAEGGPSQGPASGRPSFPRTYPFGYQFKALFLKNVALQRRQTGTNACQILTPLLVIVFTGVLHIIITNLINNSVGSAHDYTPQSMFVWKNQTRWNSPTYDLWVTDETGGSLRSTLGGLSRDCTRTAGILGRLPQLTLSAAEAAVANASCIPWTVESGNQSAVIKTLSDEKKFRVQMLTEQFANYAGTEEHKFPLAWIRAGRSDSGNLQFDLSLEEEGDLYESFSYVGPSPIARAALRSTILNSYMLEQGSTAMLEESVMIMPSKAEDVSMDFGSYIYSYLTPFALSFLLPVFTYTLVHEKQQRLREMMKMMGLKMGMYWSINFVYDVALYFVVVIIYILIGIAFGLRVFVQTSGLVQFLLYAGWGLSQITFAFLLSCFFSKSRNATIGTYMIAIFSVLISFIWNLAAFPLSNGTEAFWVVMLYPPWSAYRAFYVIGYKCGSMECPESVTHELQTCFLVLWISVPVFLVLAVYLDQVIPQEFGVARHPLYFLDPLRKYFRSKGGEQSSGLNSVSPREVDETGRQVAEGDVLDADVAEEEKIVQSYRGKPDAGEEAPVLVHNVRKVYGSGADKKVALHGVSLRVQRNECLGLLGPNGAGKTTLISVLTGLFPATDGTAEIAGFDVKTQMDEIHKNLGMCPQFDTLWPELTPLETLVFYARVRGIAGNTAFEAAKHLLRSVGLGEVMDRQVSALSGGMRRRLSIAVSLVGEPKVLFLDEPTTGLDVITRRELWDVLMSAQEGRSTVLTTHSMEEADALCQRIAIVTSGKLKAVGSNVHLKDRYGGGYSIRVSFKPENEDRVNEFISGIAPGSQESDSLKGYKAFRIPAGISVAGLFRQMVDSHGVIENWGLAQASLEDVFLTLVRGTGKHL